MSVTCLSRSCLVIASRLMEGGAMLARQYRAGSGVGFRLPGRCGKPGLALRPQLKHDMTVPRQGYSTQPLSSTMPLQLF